MADGFSVHVDDAAVQKRVERLALFMQDLLPFWPLVVPIATSWWKRMFDTEGAFAGTPWEPLAPATVDAKARLGLRAEILQATGQLKQAASSPTRAATPTTLTLMIDDSGPAHDAILAYHQTGTATMPARPLIFGSPLPAEAQAELDAAAAVYVRDLLGRV